MSERLVASYVGEYYHYDVKEEQRGVIFTEWVYHIYRDGKYWKTASSPESAYSMIKENDPSAKKVDI